jgi:uridine kinase
MIGAVSGGDFPPLDLGMGHAAAAHSAAAATHAARPSSHRFSTPVAPATSAAAAPVAAAQSSPVSPGFGVSSPSMMPGSGASGSVRWTVGRAPWYDGKGQRAAPFFIGVTGGSASGKTSVCKAIVERLDIPWVGLLSMDRFYRPLTDEEQEIAHAGNYNFDHPNSFDQDQLYKTIMEMRTGKVVDVPIYDFGTHSRLKETDRMYGVDVVIVEGILLLYDKRVRDLMDLKIYVDTDSDLRLARRITRDIRERGRSVQNVLEQYQRTVKPSFEEFILPTKRFADLIIPWNDTNQVAIDLLTQHIVSRLEKRHTDHVRVHRTMRPRCPPELLLPSQLPSTVTVLEQTRSLRALHTQVRDATSDPDEFNFNLSRLVQRVLQEALAVVPYKQRDVVTPTGSVFHGTEIDGSVCTVSIVRTGEVFETAVRALLPEVPVGKIVIQQAVARKFELGPRLYYAKLPAQLAAPDTTVFLFDGVLATGGAVIMAVQVLLDHGVLEENIVFCCIIAAPEGLHKVTTEFPALRVVTSWVDEGLDANMYVTPGVGYLGDRYYGTGAGVPGVGRVRSSPSGSFAVPGENSTGGNGPDAGE